jgi:hypothetical protein
MGTLRLREVKKPTQSHPPVCDKTVLESAYHGVLSLLPLYCDQALREDLRCVSDGSKTPHLDVVFTLAAWRFSILPVFMPEF